jgi:hypothetical protein
MNQQHSNYIPGNDKNNQECSWFIYFRAKFFYHLSFLIQGIIIYNIIKLFYNSKKNNFLSFEIPFIFIKIKQKFNILLKTIMLLFLYCKYSNDKM